VRGYGSCGRARDGAIVRDAADAPPGETLDVRVRRARGARSAVRSKRVRESV
jgi:hypothetical protein